MQHAGYTGRKKYFSRQYIFYLATVLVDRTHFGNVTYESKSDGYTSVYNTWERILNYSFARQNIWGIFDL